MTRLAWICVGTAILLAASIPARADYEFTNVSESALDSYFCRVACSPEGAIVVAWYEANGQVFTRACRNGVWEPKLSHGGGASPALCYGLGRFHLAFAVGSTVYVQSGDGGSWDAPAVLSGGASQVQHPDVGASPFEWLPDLYVTWSEGDGEQVWFCRKEGDLWQAPELITTVTVLSDPAQPAVRATWWQGPPRPRVYYFDDFELRYMEHNGTDWQESFLVKDYAGFDFDVAAGPVGQHSVLTLLPQVPCPCNRIYFTTEVLGEVWSDPEELTDPQGYYTWTQHPAVAVDPDPGQTLVHAFWYEEYYDEYLNQTGDALYYRTWNGYGWTDRSLLLQGHAGPWCDLTLDPQGDGIFTWAELMGSSRDILVAWNRDPSASGGGWAATSADLRIVPNPVRDGATIVCRLGAATEVRLELFDLGGRRAARLLEGTVPAGVHPIRWDGRGENGANLPRGVYFARLTWGGRTLTRSLQLVE